ncbi:hypothetical protein [Actinomadura sp. WMMB 499]|uniref:hypothetical protein n=1 Tax=Actinomadura sp. WMMB 499 TaxID=1219491 RepID=UPI001243CE7F|nr:hypothetical protein [Actinomadura sp. WMMB 499]QFG22993.1 hypothetical protein F7P10_19590 [Actinomadura sp. WMMB 499]
MAGERLYNATSYIPSFQDPGRWLRDPELRAGTVVRPPGGTLRAMDGGGFGSIFRIVSADGRRSWAVKCFLRPTAELSTRYRAIERALADVHDYWKVDFGFDAEGLFHLPQQRWVPLLKMSWVNGEPLIPWIEDRLGNAMALRRMALEFTKVVRALERAGIAHGDLQHGNIIVVAGDRIRLIDYDGMFVPGLAGFPVVESGIPHYRSPDRAGRGYFGPAGDRFAARVIRLGIRAVAAEPGLWGRFHEDGGDFLILRNADFAAPAESAAFDALAVSRDAWVRAETVQLLRDLTAPPELIPPLQEPDGGPSVPEGTDAPAWLLRPATRSLPADRRPPPAAPPPEPVPVPEPVPEPEPWSLREPVAEAAAPAPEAPTVPDGLWVPPRGPVPFDGPWGAPTARSDARRPVPWRAYGGITAAALTVIALITALVYLIVR